MQIYLQFVRHGYAATLMWSRIFTIKLKTWLAAILFSAKIAIFAKNKL